MHNLTLILGNSEIRRIFICFHFLSRSDAIKISESDLSEIVIAVRSWLRNAAGRKQ